MYHVISIFYIVFRPFCLSLHLVSTILNDYDERVFGKKA